MEESLKQQIKLILKKGDETIDDMQALFDLGRFAAASSRAYYAVFHVLQALLLTKSLSFSKHSGVISGFSKYFIKEGIFPPEYAGKVKKLWKYREIGDYEYDKKISEQQAEECLENAKLIVSSLKNYIEKITAVE